jgi:hypothetical protein
MKWSRAKAFSALQNEFIYCSSFANLHFSATYFLRLAKRKKISQAGRQAEEYDI